MCAAGFLCYTCGISSSSTDVCAFLCVGRVRVFMYVCVCAGVFASWLFIQKKVIWPCTFESETINLHLAHGLLSVISSGSC